MITNDWRKTLSEWQKNGEWLERLAAKLPDDIP